VTRRPPLYGLDIETDTTVDGLDPHVARILTVAIATAAGNEVFSGDEAALLERVDMRLAQLPPGVIATWNGGAFDLPFLADRAERCGLRLGLRLELDATIHRRGAPLPGHQGSYRAGWYRHRHVDAYRVYRGDVGPMLRVSCSLKSIARLVGLRAVEVDRTRIHELEHDVLHAYAANDAGLTRALAERRWASAARHVDRLGPAGTSFDAGPVTVLVPSLPSSPRPAATQLV
jgi:DNA polymerase elongation subunit (family B)